MKYPEKQFNELCEAVKVIETIFTKEVLLNTNANQIHFFVFVNKTYPDSNPNVKFINGKRLFNINDSFELYPNDCNDTNIETAVKQALKTI